MKLVKYTQQYVIETFEGKLYFISEDLYKPFKAALLEDRFVEVDSELINTSSIKRVYKSQGDAALTSEQKKALESRKKDFKGKLGRWPTANETSKIISKILLNSK